MPCASQKRCAKRRRPPPFGNLSVSVTRCPGSTASMSSATEPSANPPSQMKVRNPASVRARIRSARARAAPRRCGRNTGPSMMRSGCPVNSWRQHCSFSQCTVARWTAESSNRSALSPAIRHATEVLPTPSGPVITTTRRRLRSRGNGFLPRYSLEVPERKAGDNEGLLDTVKRLLEAQDQRAGACS